MTSKLTLQDITAKRRFGWFAVKQDLSPRLRWAASLKQGNMCAKYAWEAGPRVGDFTDGFFKRNWCLPWRIGTNTPKYSQRSDPLFIQLIGVSTVGEATTYAMDALRRHCNKSEQGTWKIFVFDAYSYLIKGLNSSSHVRCIVEVNQ